MLDVWEENEEMRSDEEGKFGKNEKEKSEEVTEERRGSKRGQRGWAALTHCASSRRSVLRLTWSGLSPSRTRLSRPAMALLASSSVLMLTKP